MYKIYLLKCPYTKEIVYVGQTKTELLVRLVGHLHDAYHRDRLVKDKQNWISKLLQEGRTPIIELIEETANKAREVYWIEYYKPKYNIQYNESEFYKEFLSNRTSVKVYQYNLDGSFVKEWKSATLAGIEYSIDNTNICSCVSGKRRQAGGYMWTNFKKDSIKAYKKDIFMKEVYVYDIEGNYLESYTSSRHIPDMTHKAVYKVCQGKLHSHKGYRFSYNKVNKLEPIVKRPYGSRKVKI